MKLPLTPLDLLTRWGLLTDDHTGRHRTAVVEPLLGDPYPLARLIARAALGRRESRGPHRRSDHPHRDPGLNGVHLVIGPDPEISPEATTSTTEPPAEEETTEETISVPPTDSEDAPSEPATAEGPS